VWEGWKKDESRTRHFGVNPKKEQLVDHADAEIHRKTEQDIGLILELHKMKKKRKL
jgi:hypothetical protein